MKKILCLLLVLATLTACNENEIPPIEDTTVETTPKEEVVEESSLFWTTGISPVEYEINGAVTGTTETYIEDWRMILTR